MIESGKLYALMLVDDHEVVRSGYRRFLQADAVLAVVLDVLAALLALRCCRR